MPPPVNRLRKHGDWTVTATKISSNSLLGYYRPSRFSPYGWKVDKVLHGLYEGPLLHFFTVDSDMHTAIKRQDFEEVQRLLDAGDKFCTGDGRNCFMEVLKSAPSEVTSDNYKEVFNFLKKMLAIEPRGVFVKDNGKKKIFNTF
jgi:hypothetical protein